MSKKSDKSRLRRAVIKRNNLTMQSVFSASAELDPHVGIVVASHTRDKEKLLREAAEEELDFVAEAELIMEDARNQNMEASIITAKNRYEAMQFIGNRSLTDLVFIGHGHLGQLHLRDEKLRWAHVSRHIDHLKTGSVIQRHCGVRWDNMNIALGAFVVQDMRKVIAPVGEFFNPTSLYDEYSNSLLTPVYSEEHMSYNNLLAMSGQQDDDVDIID